MEAILAGWPCCYDLNDIATALESSNVGQVFAASIDIIKRERKPDLLNLTVLQVAVLIWCEDHSILELASFANFSNIQRLWRSWASKMHLLKPIAARRTFVSLPITLACFNPTVKILRYIHTQTTLLVHSPDVVALAAFRGNLDSIEFLRRIGSRGFDAMTVDNAAASGNLELLQWLHSKRPKIFRKKKLWWNSRLMLSTIPAVACAAMYGQLVAVEWFLEKDCDVGWKTMYWATANNHHDIVKRLYGHNGSALAYHRLQSWKVRGAIENGHMEIIKWIHETFQQDYRSENMETAAANGHLEMVKWLHENCPEGCSEAAMDGAARNGHLEVVKWLHGLGSAGCSVDAMDGAARHGHLDVVEWLHQNREEGCSERAMKLAARGGHIHVVEWLLANRSETWESAFGSPLHEAAKNGHLDIVKLLVGFGYRSWFTATDDAAGNGHLEVLEFLHEHKLADESYTKEAMDRAARGGYLEVVKWLHANREEGCTQDAVDWAAGNGHIEVMKWLRQNRTEGFSLKAFTLASRNCRFKIVKELLGDPGCRTRFKSREVKTAIVKGCNGFGFKKFMAEAKKRGCELELNF
ncbi:hypothetical protein HDU97_007823 [Phlyctochytrium planicorne]|nr:hypothetical protein HDU97_007823 [Phlyctochytrium planicorne]